MPLRLAVKYLGLSLRVLNTLKSELNDASSKKKITSYKQNVLISK